MHVYTYLGLYTYVRNLCTKGYININRMKALNLTKQIKSRPSFG